ncbi:MAG: metallopeptidase family protein [Acidimicrobiia bacterium]
MRLSDFEEVVDRALEELPEWVVAKIDNLIIVVEEHPPRELGDVLGVYEGVDLSQREDYFGAMPDRILIFRQPHLALGLGQKALEAEIRKTVLHELGHHLGIDDARLAELGWA